MSLEEILGEIEQNTKKNVKISQKKLEEQSKGKDNTNKINSKPADGTTESRKEWGYDLYPERRNRLTGMDKFMKGRDNIDKLKCERNVYKCIKRSPLVKLMMGALKSSGCAIDIRRHIACEECDSSVTGGYDPEYNQIVICHNMVKSENLVQGILTHEMIHMFDYCRNNLNFKDIDHLACTEIRAANLTQCSYLSACFEGTISPFHVKQAHQDCVKSKAYQSIIAVRNVTKHEAYNAIERVFDRCYADLEPIGRRLRRGSNDMAKAYAEGFFYGYDPV